MLLNLHGQIPGANWLRALSKVTVNPAFVWAIGELCQAKVSSLCGSTAAAGTREGTVQNQGGSVSGPMPAYACSYRWWIYGWGHGPAYLNREILYHAELAVSWKGVLWCQCFTESK